MGKGFIIFFVYEAIVQYFLFKWFILRNGFCCHFLSLPASAASFAGKLIAMQTARKRLLRESLQHKLWAVKLGEGSEQLRTSEDSPWTIAAKQSHCARSGLGKPNLATWEHFHVNRKAIANEMKTRQIKKLMPIKNNPGEIRTISC